MTSVRIDTLPGGLRVASDRMDHVETVSIGVYVGAGTRHEPAALNGVAHMLEHMAFKGTARRDAKAIAEEIENPFGTDPNDLPLESICETIRKSVTEILGDAAAGAFRRPVD